ncbi:MAG: GspH/FimT family pseudopilin [Phycisphaerales bacterium]|nr:GspH/FimT family pseudopilin [Phycisphaerales bacterium]
MRQSATTISPPTGIHAGVHASACPPTSSSAFTLIELVLVLVIIAIAVGIVAPSLSAFVRSRDLSNTAVHFIAATRFARTQAISQATVYRININETEKRWWLTKADASGTNFIPADLSGQINCTLSPRLAITCSLLLPDNIPNAAPDNVPTNAQVIEFQPGGQVDPATITLTGPNNGSIQIACDSRFDLYHIVPHNGGTR